LLALPASLAIAFGVVWSNALAFASFDPAPRARLAELERARTHADATPVLFLDFEEAAKHFLRDGTVAPADAFVPAAYSTPRGSFGFPVPIGRLSVPYLDRFATIIVRRSPFAERPPAAFRLSWEGKYYEVWQRDSSLRDVGLVRPTGTRARRCGILRALVAALPSARWFAAALRPTLVELRPTERPHPAKWARDPADANVLLLNGAGSLAGDVRVRRDRRYAAWLEGSFGPSVAVALDSIPIGSVARDLNARGDFVELGRIRPGRGTHRLRISAAAAALWPGDGVTGERRLGRLLLSAPPSRARLVVVRRAAWRRLCAYPVQFVEAVVRQR
jgi:hypothetical protein